MNLNSASSRSRLSHWNAFFRFTGSAISSGFWFWNARAYAWLLATPRLKNTSCVPSLKSGSVRTPMRIGGALRSRFFGSPLSGWKKYSYSRSGLAVKSSHTKLCTGWSNVETVVSSSGFGITLSNTFTP